MRPVVRRVLLAATLATSIGLSVGLSAGPAVAVRADSSAPSLPADPSAQGYIGLCDEAGHNVVGGSAATTPFVWKAVASQGPPAQYQGTGQQAVLNIYQPRPGTVPGEWSGRGLIATSVYTSAEHPSVQATYQDSSLASFVTDFPAKVDGLYVLRMYWGKRNYGVYSATYPTTVIQVQGSRWHVVSGGTVDCSSATLAVSMEQLTGVATKQDVTPRAPAAQQSLAPSGPPRRITGTAVAVHDGDVAGGAPASGAARVSGSGALGAAGTGRQDASSSTSTSAHSWVLWTLAAAVVLLAAALAGTLRRRRIPATPHALIDEQKDRP